MKQLSSPPKSRQGKPCDESPETGVEEKEYARLDQILGYPIFNDFWFISLIV